MKHWQGEKLFAISKLPSLIFGLEDLGPECVNMGDFLVSRDIKIYSNGKGLGREIFTDANDCLEMMVIHIFLS